MKQKRRAINSAVRIGPRKRTEYFTARAAADKISHLMPPTKKPGFWVFGAWLVCLAGLQTQAFQPAAAHGGETPKTEIMKPCIENNPPPCADPPKIIKWADPDFSKEARKQHYSGKVVLWAVVGTDGKVHEIKVQQSIGLGLDEQAIKAVKKWRFKPGTFEGKPVPVQINAEVDFRYKD